MKPPNFKVVSLSFLSFLLMSVTSLCWAQDSSSHDQVHQTAEANSVTAVMHSTKAIDYRQGSKSEIGFTGTSLMPEATGKADVAAKSGTTQISAKFENLKPGDEC
jgi:hypothetical protein